MNVDEYLKYWDKVIQQWSNAESAEFPKSEKYWEKIKYGKRGNKTVAERIGLQKELIPQPYWGNPKRCSAVVINYNPGGSEKTGKDLLENDHSSFKFAKLRDPNTLAGAVACDRNTMLIIPDFNKDADGFWKKEHKAAWNWMKQRTEWIDRLFSNSGNKPCFLEICAWHSHNWQNVKLPNEIIEILKRDFAPVLEEAILNSDSKIGLAIGASFKGDDSILVSFGYKDVTKEICGKDAESKEGVARWYKVFCNENGTTIIVTWSRGSNRQPSEDFADCEQKLLSKINNIKNL